MRNHFKFKSPFTKNEYKIIVFCFLLRLLLFGLYDTKVSQCPDSIIFIKLAAKLQEKAASSFNNKLVENKVVEKIKIKNVEKNILPQNSKIAKNALAVIGERSPGYPVFIFLSFGIFGTVIFQFLIGIITALVIYRTAINLQFSSKSSFRITILLQCYLAIFIYETFILTEALTFFFVSVLFLHLSDTYLEKKKTIKFEIIFSLFLGILVLIKPFYVVLSIILLGIRWLSNACFKLQVDRKYTLLFFSFLFYFGWSFVVQYCTGYFVSTTYLGLNKAQNVVYFAEKAPKKYLWISKPYVKHRDMAIKENKDVSMAIWYAVNANEFQYKKMDFPELSNEFGLFAEATIKNNFGDYMCQVVTKSWFDFWKVYNIKQLIHFKNKSVEFCVTTIFEIQSSVLSIFKLAFLLISIFYFSAFIILKKYNFQLISCILVWSISILQAIVTYGTNAKYSFPFEYIMVLVVLLFVKEKLLKRKIQTNG